MRNGFKAQHWEDEEGRPAGGVSYGTGFAISWQHGPLGRGEERREPNGAFVEDIIAVCLDRLDYYERSVFHCPENQNAMASLRAALGALEERTRNREARGVEGTHQR